MSLFTKLKKSRLIQSLKLVQIVYYPFYRRTVNSFDIKIYDSLATVQMLQATGNSISRFGDGEFKLMYTEQGIGFQAYNAQLAGDLRDVLVPQSQHVIGLPHAFKSTSADKLMVKVFWWKYVYDHRDAIQQFIADAQTNEFYDASFSRTVIELQDRQVIHQTIEEVKALWADRDVIMIEGQKTRFGVGNDLFDQARSVQRILGPADNSYARIDDIMQTVHALVKTSNDPSRYLVLGAMGPTASVLAYRLRQHGVQMIDIGHFDLQYEYLQRGSYHRVKVKDKYDNEQANQATITDPASVSYAQEIVASFPHQDGQE